MLKSIKISNYKSIEQAELPLGRINVLIGENGAGKSNILEAIALAGAAAVDKLDNEFLVSRGIRVTDPHLMRPAFSEETAEQPVEIGVRDADGNEHLFELKNDNAPYSQWKGQRKEHSSFSAEEIFHTARQMAVDGIALAKESTESVGEIGVVVDGVRISFDLATVLKKATEVRMAGRFADFLGSFVIYSPENTALRTFEREGQIEPLGINGEGLFKLLSVMFDGDDHQAIAGIRRCLGLFGWFEDIAVAPESAAGARSIRVKDRFVEATRRMLDQKSVNEGFLFILFYGALFSSRLTPHFFAVDNIDASLNPKLCERLMVTLGELARENDKQVVLTTHNPAILDGLDLGDADTRLFVVSRGSRGQTRIRPVDIKPHPADGKSLRLSEAFLRGALGGLPKGF